MVSKKKGKVDIRHRVGTKNEEELRLELTLGGSPESQKGKGSERALEERMASPWRNTELWLLPRQEAASESAPDGKYYHRCMHLDCNMA